MLIILIYGIFLSFYLRDLLALLVTLFTQRSKERERVPYLRARVEL